MTPRPFDPDERVAITRRGLEAITGLEAGELPRILDDELLRAELEHRARELELELDPSPGARVWGACRIATAYEGEWWLAMLIGADDELERERDLRRLENRAGEIWDAARLELERDRSCAGCGIAGAAGLAGWHRAYLRLEWGPGARPELPRSGVALICPQCAPEWMAEILAYRRGAENLIAILAITDAGTLPEKGE